MALVIAEGGSFGYLLFLSVVVMCLCCRDSLRIIAGDPDEAEHLALIRCMERINASMLIAIQKAFRDLPCILAQREMITLIITVILPFY